MRRRGELGARELRLAVDGVGLEAGHGRAEGLADWIRDDLDTFKR